MIIQKVSQNQFEAAFKNYNRELNFSPAGFKALFDHLEDFTEHYELDVIGLCCEFTEYSNLSEFHDDYDITDFPDQQSIADHTLVLSLGEAFVIQNF